MGSIQVPKHRCLVPLQITEGFPPDFWKCWASTMGKKQGGSNPKHTKTFQSFPSPLNISCSLQNFLWTQRPQSGTSLEERSFVTLLVLPHPRFSLNNKIFYLICSSEPRTQYETWSFAIRVLSGLRLGLFFLIISAGVSELHLWQP